MNISEAIQTIKKDLESTFGVTLATSIIAISRTKANAPLIGMTKQNYLDLIIAICCDSRVPGMLGSAGANERLSKWKRLVD